eukprot:4894585-Prorocentrum_lima.AAC.1
MHWEIVKRVFRLTMKSDCKTCTPSMVAQAEDIYMGLGQTKVLEDGMGRFRRAEKVESENKAILIPHTRIAPIYQAQGPGPDARVQGGWMEPVCS